jgi:hypothetical protein
MGKARNILYTSPVVTAMRAGPARSGAGLIASTSLSAIFIQFAFIFSATQETGSAGSTDQDTHT